MGSVSTTILPSQKLLHFGPGFWAEASGCPGSPAVLPRGLSPPPGAVGLSTPVPLPALCVQAWAAGPAALPADCPPRQASTSGQRVGSRWCPSDLLPRPLSVPRVGLMC